MTEQDAFEHWVNTFDGGLVVNNRLIWAAATKAEREACAKVCEAGISRYSNTVMTDGGFWIDDMNGNEYAAAIRVRK